MDKPVKILLGSAAVILLLFGTLNTWQFISAGGNPYSSYTADVTAEVTDVREVRDTIENKTEFTYISVASYRAGGREYEISFESTERPEKGSKTELAYDPEHPENAVNAGLRNTGGYIVLVTGVISMLMGMFFVAALIISAGEDKNNEG